LAKAIKARLGEKEVQVLAAAMPLLRLIADAE
jgi:hypothetical protein